jgi:hypothetical protein
MHLEQVRNHSHSKAVWGKVGKGPLDTLQKLHHLSQFLGNKGRRKEERSKQKRKELALDFVPFVGS